MPQRNASSQSCEEVKESAERLLRSGQIVKARKLLDGLKASRVPRPLAGEFAKLMRRAGRPQSALKILWPYLRPDRPSALQASPDEKGEYAVALLTVGATQEATDILSGIQGASSVLSLYLGFAFMTRWDYRSAISQFHRYLGCDGLAPYDRLLAQVNLAAAHVALGDSDEARPLLDEIVKTAEREQWQLLRKNALELGAQLAATRREWELAESLLSRIDSGSGTVEDVNDLFVRKWRALIALHRSGGSRPALARIDDVRAHALRLRHWETLRDCDFHQALALRDRKLYQTVYFGTPYESYRRRLEAHAAGWMEFPGEYLWASGQPRRILDLKRGREADGGPEFKIGGTVHRALRALTSDFYRPQLVGGLHSLLFPQEYFNPDTGPLRVRQAMARLRAWLADHEVPIDVVSGPEGARLRLNDDYGILLTSAETRIGLVDKPGFAAMLGRLLDTWPEGEFSSAQAARALGISDRLARDLLRWAADGKRVGKTGAGPKTRYVFAAADKREAA